MYVNNDCSTAAECAKRFGHKRQEIKLGDPYASEPYAYRFANRSGDDKEEDYHVVVYWTISSGTNIGVKIGDSMFKGEFGTIPEYGHHFHVEKDPFGNKILCGDGAVGHLEAAISGSGIARMLRTAVKSGAISSGLTSPKTSRKRSGAGRGPSNHRKSPEAAISCFTVSGWIWRR